MSTATHGVPKCSFLVVEKNLDCTRKIFVRADTVEFVSLPNAKEEFQAICQS